MAGGGMAGTVTVDNAAHITTNDASSTGIVAQSIGGGGGNGGFAATGNFSLDSGAASNSVGGAGGNGGQGSEGGRGGCGHATILQRMLN